MTLEEAKEVLRERQRVNRILYSGIEDFDKFVWNEANAIEIVLRALEEKQ
ncbi:MAG: hypothetical protein PWP16_1329 [Eubacteriaceae bacterium]|jgi:hypothetical protein|nr:hypothetical protein [Eubacteriaceae bacterium]